MARHRSPGGRRHIPGTVPGADATVKQPSHRRQGAHRMRHPSPAARGRLVVVAVATGAVAAAVQGLEEQPLRTDAGTLLALGTDILTETDSAETDSAETDSAARSAADTGYTGMGGNDPDGGVILAQAEAVPAVLPQVVSVATQNTLAEDVTSLAKGERLAEERAAEARAAAEQARADAERVAAEIQADARWRADGAGGTAARAAQELRGALGKVVLPARGVLTSGFGGRWGTTHYGLDIANAIGTPIYATADGVVVESGPANGFGMWVKLLHNDGTISVYGHINTSLVTEGQQVGVGEQIATMGNRGQSTGPHLHFEIWLDGTEKVNPLSWLRRHGVNV